MKTRLATLGLLLILIIVTFWSLRHRQSDLAELPPVKANSVLSVAVPLTNTPSTVEITNIGNLIPEEFAKIIPKLEEQRKARMEKALDEWRTPIEFYGVVEDESNNVVPGAKVEFSCNDISPTGTSFYRTTSGVNGGFSITGIRGKLLVVSVNKDGYYEYAPAGLAFNYAGENQNFVPDAGNPVVFRLRKKGEGATLIHFHKGFPIPKDGTPVLIDLATGGTNSGNGSTFAVECWTDDVQKIQGWKFAWKCRISVPGGGLQVYDDIFPFLAPDQGYHPDETVDMTDTKDQQWSQDVRRNYYVKTADGRFARLQFRMIAHGDHFCQIDSFFNPSGSPNLEPTQ